MNERVDYEAIRKQFSIEQVAAILGLEGKKRGEQIRARCPITDSGELVITPSKNAFYCFSPKCRVGGSQLELYAHVKGIYLHDAAVELSKLAPSYECPELLYLLPKHTAVQSLGMTVEVAEKLGAGYAPRGTLIGRVCLPMYDKSGKRVCYIGYAQHLSPKLKIGRCMV